MATTKSKPEPPPAKRPRGRPPGTGQGAKVKKISVSLPLDLYDWLVAQPNASAEVTAALRAHIARRRPRSRR